jgi:hypothetical protein
VSVIKNDNIGCFANQWLGLEAFRNFSNLQSFQKLWNSMEILWPLVTPPNPSRHFKRSTTAIFAFTSWNYVMASDPRSWEFCANVNLHNTFNFWGNNFRLRVDGDTFGLLPALIRCQFICQVNNCSDSLQRFSAQAVLIFVVSHDSEIRYVIIQTENDAPTVQCIWLKATQRGWGNPWCKLARWCSHRKNCFFFSAAEISLACRH